MLIDRKKILQGMVISDSEYKVQLNRFCDLVDRVLKHHTTEYTYFVSPDILGDFFQILDQVRDVNYTVFGGYKEAEYVLIALHPEYIESIDISGFPISMLVIEAGKQQAAIGHRDVLGSLMGLGFSRSRMGDIVLLEDKVQVMILNEMVDYALSGLDRVGRTKVTIHHRSVADFEEKPLAYKDISTTVKSVRLDALVASAFGISRGKAVDFIKGKKVKINYRPVTIPSKELHEGDMVSVRSKGRFVLSEILDRTKKDRIKIIMKKVI